jgi:hypothetical protein
MMNYLQVVAETIKKLSVVSISKLKVGKTVRNTLDDLYRAYYRCIDQNFNDAYD